MLNSFRYYVKQAVSSLLRNTLMSLTSVFTVVCCMLILGVFLVVSININYIAEQIQNQCEIQAFVPKTTTNQQYLALAEQIRQIENVRAGGVVIFSKKDTLEYAREMFGEKRSLLDGYDNDAQNPFRDSYKISLDDLSKIDQTMETLRRLNGIEEVVNKRDAVDNILRITAGIKNASLWGMILLGVVSIFIIANTIKITVFSRRREINVMKFVGATDWFIRWPFVIEGVLIGIIGAVVAYALIAWGYTALLVNSAGSGMMMFRFRGFSELWNMMLAVCLGLGTLIGAAGSGLAVRKHLQV